MGHWQIFDAAGVAQHEQFDDGLAFQPGEGGFSTDAVAAQAASLGKGSTFSLISVPNWHARIEAEQREKAEAERVEREAAELAAQKASDQVAQQQAREVAEAELAAMLDPKAPIRAQVNAKFDAMLTALPDRAKDIKALRKAARAAVES